MSQYDLMSYPHIHISTVDNFGKVCKMSKSVGNDLARIAAAGERICLITI